jgi:hypothetical protein
VRKLLPVFVLLASNSAFAATASVCHFALERKLQAIVVTSKGYFTTCKLKADDASALMYRYDCTDGTHAYVSWGSYMPPSALHSKFKASAKPVYCSFLRYY